MSYDVNNEQLLLAMGEKVMSTLILCCGKTFRWQTFGAGVSVNISESLFCQILANISFNAFFRLFFLRGLDF